MELISTPYWLTFLLVLWSLHLKLKTCSFYSVSALEQCKLSIKNFLQSSNLYFTYKRIASTQINFILLVSSFSSILSDLYKLLQVIQLRNYSDPPFNYWNIQGTHDQSLHQVSHCFITLKNVSPNFHLKPMKAINNIFTCNATTDQDKETEKDWWLMISSITIYYYIIYGDWKNH